MSDDEQSERGFRVRDRRHFHTDGSPRDDVEEEPERPAAPAARANEPASAGPRPLSAANEPPPGAIDFVSFIASLATNAMAAMGALPEARAQGLPRDPQLAREYIDILALLQQKTRGNLSQREEATLQQLLTQLRMAFVEVERGGGKSGR